MSQAEITLRRRMPAFGCGFVTFSRWFRSLLFVAHVFALEGFGGGFVGAAG
jgi:hypothetical protein